MSTEQHVRREDLYSNLEERYVRCASEVASVTPGHTTAWAAVVGAASSGKTTTVRLLEGLGYAAVHDATRRLLDENLARGIDPFETRSNEELFQRAAFCATWENIRHLSPSDLVFHDYGLADSIVFYRLAGLKVPQVVWQVARSYVYQQVFVLDPLEWERDGIRTEERDTQLQIHSLLLVSCQAVSVDNSVLVRSAQ